MLGSKFGLKVLLLTSLMSMQSVYVKANQKVPVPVKIASADMQFLGLESRGHHHKSSSSDSSSSESESDSSTSSHKVKEPSCHSSITISSVPVVIDKPGYYCVTNDLTYTGSESAIDIRASNVNIDFKGHVLTIPSTASLGISAQYVSDLLIKNGTIRCEAVSEDPNNAAIQFFSNMQRVRFEKMVTQNTRRGIFALATGTDPYLSGFEEITINNCAFTHPGETGRGVQIGRVRDLVVENCAFNECGSIALFVSTDGRNVRINNCTFFNEAVFGSGVFVQTAQDEDVSLTTNVEITNCAADHNNFGIVVTNNGTVNLSQNTLIQNCNVSHGSVFPLFVGGVTATQMNTVIQNCNISGMADTVTNVLFQQVETLLVENCNFLNKEANDAFLNVTITNGHGVIFNNCQFDSNPAGLVDDPLNLGTNLYIFEIEPGEPPLAPSDNIKVMNCLFLNNPKFHVYTLRGTRALSIENCSFDQAREAAMFFDGLSDSIVQNCLIGNSSGKGIRLDAQSVRNTIQGNTFSNNADDGLFLGVDSGFNTIIGNISSNNGGNGIFIGCSSTNNTIKDNATSNNGSDGINNQGGASNEFYGNSACHNGNVNYENIAPLVAPGSPAVTGGNISCS